MILKSADDKSERVSFLEALQRSTELDAHQKKWAKDELFKLRKGVQGEKDAAFYLNGHFKDGANHVLLHDLRIIVEGEVAQIDHLIFNRAGSVYLIETKNYSANIEINEQGEFTAHYADMSFGIPSPVEQSRRHERTLNRLFERLDINGRTQKGIDCHHVVMFNPKARIQRPSGKSMDTSAVIKSDQFPTWHKRFIDKEIGVFQVVKGLANLRSRDTLEEWGQMLLRQHRPTDTHELPDFMKPALEKHPRPASKKAPTSESRFQPKPDATAPTPVVATAPATATLIPPEKKLICATCGAKISFPEGKFCWGNAKRFGGLQYCREHQAAFS